MSLIIPENYKSNLNGRETEKAIKFIKDTFNCFCRLCRLCR